MTTQSPEFLERSDGAKLAYNKVAGASPGIVFLHGLMSDRDGTKALALAEYCARAGRACIRFDMFGHGASTGRFEDGNISRWTDDAAAVIDHLTEGPQILVGSSMGGWVMVRAALARPDNVAGLIGIAPGPDFTEDITWPGLSKAERETLETKGIVNVQSDYDVRPYPISRQLIEDGRKNLVLRGPIPLSCPVRLIHGQKDTAVPWETSMRLAENISGDDVNVLLVKNGDHRLSEAADIERLCMVLDELIRRVQT
tara:strand:- start:345 stop:1109 length:765 start_codon:yes stop_codon:yes gene_type:complete